MVSETMRKRMTLFKGFKRHQELLRSILSQDKKITESNKESPSAASIPIGISDPTEAALRILSVSHVEAVPSLIYKGPHSLPDYFL